MCLYPSKRCDNPRVLKTNGELHKFCLFHRDKANYNQRQLEFKRRIQQEQSQSSEKQNIAQGEEDFELDDEDIRLIEEVAAANMADGRSLDNQ